MRRNGQVLGIALHVNVWMVDLRLTSAKSTKKLLAARTFGKIRSISANHSDLSKTHFTFGALRGIARFKASELVIKTEKGSGITQIHTHRHSIVHSFGFHLGLMWIQGSDIEDKGVACS